MAYQIKPQTPYPNPSDRSTGSRPITSFMGLNPPVRRVTRFVILIAICHSVLIAFPNPRCLSKIGHTSHRQFGDIVLVEGFPGFG